MRKNPNLGKITGFEIDLSHVTVGICFHAAQNTTFVLRKIEQKFQINLTKTF